MSLPVWAHVLLCVLQCHSALCYSESKRAWQLGDKAGACEKETSVDAEHPKLTDPITVGSGHPSLSYKAFSSDGRVDYVKVGVGDMQMNIFSLFLLVYPTTPSGTVAHYKYGSGGTDGIDEIVISINRGVVNVLIIYNSNDWTFTHPTPITVNTWHRVVLKRDMDAGKVHLDLDGTPSTRNAAPKDTVEYLGTPGKLWLGRNVESGNFFTGKMTCVLFYDSMFADAEISGAYKECDLMSRSPGPSQIIDPDAPPVALWRLDNTTYGYRIGGIAPQHPVQSECARLADGCPEIPSRQSLMLDGASISYLDLNLKFGALQEQFQIALFVNPGIPSSGTILHFRYTGTEAGIRDVKLAARSSNMTLILCDSSSCCDSVDHTVALTADVWHFVIIERSRRYIGLVIDASNVTRDAACVGGPTDITDTGQLRVGQALDVDDRLRGSITCMAVYGHVSSGADRKSKHISFCQDLVPPQSLFDTEVCLRTPTYRHKYYSLECENVEPDVDVSDIMTSATVSLRQCGSLCIATKCCLAFTLTGVSSQRQCKLYDYVTRDEGLRTKPNTKYFVMK